MPQQHLQQDVSAFLIYDLWNGPSVSVTFTKSAEHKMSRILVVGGGTEVGRQIGEAITAANFPVECAAGGVDALQRFRMKSFGVVISSPDGTVEEDLALLQEMRSIRPGVKSVVLAHHSTPVEVIAALRARVFACFTPPFNVGEIAGLACSAASENPGSEDIQVLSAEPEWVSLRVNCRLITAERLMTFANQFIGQLPEETRNDMMQAFREVLMNAMEHGAAFNAEQVVEVNVIRTKRAMVFYLRDPGAGFRRESLVQVAGSNPANDPAAHIVQLKECVLAATAFCWREARSTS
jgi:DNA-binding response OmpR family regulator